MKYVRIYVQSQVAFTYVICFWYVHRTCTYVRRVQNLLL